MADVTLEPESLSERYHFLIRRLHSLSGIIPVGVFICIHLSVNATIIAGGDAFQFAVDQIHLLANLGILKMVEVCFIFLPIAFHAIVGLLIWLTSKPNLMAFRYGGNLRYTLQRWTGIAVLIFIVIHLWHVHWIIGEAAFDPHSAAETAVSAMAKLWAGPVYALGVLLAVFHLANGIWTFLISWGITIGPRSQVISGGACAIIGILLTLLGMGSLVRLKTMDVPTHSPPAVTESHGSTFEDAGIRPS